MKKSLLLLALFLPMLVFAQSIHHSVSFKSDALKLDVVKVDGKTFTIPQYTDLHSSGLEVGEPILPQKFISFAVPVEATDITLTNVANEAGAVYNLTYPVKPEPEPTIAGSTNPIKEEFEPKDFVESNIVRNTDEYKPLLSPGKKWKYTHVDVDFWTSKVSVYDETITARNPIEVDGVEYFPVNYSKQNEDEYALLREDIKNKVVWFKYDKYSLDNLIVIFHKYGRLFDKIAQSGEPYQPEYKLYDFNNLNDCLTTYSMTETGNVEITTVEETINAPKYTDMDTSSSFAFIEGIGIVSLYDNDKDSYTSDLFGEQSRADIMWQTSYIYLYEVVDGDGTVLYYDESKTPGMVGLKAIGVDDGASVYVTGNVINVSAKSGDNTFALYSIDGKEIMKRKIGARAAITTDGIPAGVYFVKVGSTTKKIRI